MVTINNLTYSYKEHTPIFHDFNFSSKESFIVFKGDSGSGKTTLLKLISGHLPSKDVINFKLGSIKQPNIAYLAQNDALFPWLTGWDNIIKLLKINRDDIVSHPFFSSVSDFINKRAFECSFGQRRMIELFRIMLYMPHILCLDEPLNFLDEDKRRIFMNKLSQMVDDNILHHVIMCTHHQEELDGLKCKTYYFQKRHPISSLSE